MEWKPAPNMFSEWGKVPKDRTDYVLTVRPIMIHGANDSVIAETEFPESTAARLVQLRATLDKE
ncbi:hypothetical protein llg_11170 [Luteolibacter sp. LG18]|nr:hypothetical protein llg_11170 [Luteolibacter sp. LG18]